MVVLIHVVLNLLKSSGRVLGVVLVLLKLSGRVREIDLQTLQESYCTVFRKSTERLAR